VDESGSVATSEQPSGRLGGRPLRPLVVLSLVTLVDQIDTNVLRGVLPLIEDDFGLADWQLGFIGFAFIFVHAIAAIPAGWIADRVSRTRLIGFTLLSWSGLSLGAALAQNFVQLVLARASLGFGQAVDDPASTSLLADTYPPEVRGRVFSVQQVTLFIGGGIGIGLGGFVGDTFGWQWAFALVGMPGSLVALLVFGLREPARGEADGVALPVPEPIPVRELARGAVASFRSDLKMIFGIRTMRFVMVGFSVMLFSIAGISYWLAVYHERFSGFTEKESAGVAAGLLTIGGLVGTFAGGAISDRLYGVSPAARITHVSNAILGCMVFFISSLAVPIVPLRLAMQFVAILSAATALPGLRASLMDVTPVQARGMTTSAFALTSTVLGTASAPLIVGGLSDLTGSLVTAFVVVTPPTILGAIILRRARHTIVEDAAAIFAGLAQRAEDRPGGEAGDGPEISL
jgi:MFS family permease